MVYSIYTIFAIGHPSNFSWLQALKFDCIEEDYTVVDGDQARFDIS